MNICHHRPIMREPFRKDYQRLLLWCIWIGVVLLGALLFCDPFSKAWATADSRKSEIVLKLRWYHQFQFAGYYAALEKGFYRDAGLTVSLAEGEIGVDPVRAVLEGDAQYGVSDSELLLHWMQGKPLVVLAAIFQHSPLVFVARANTGIDHPQDLIGKRVMMTRHSRDMELHAILKNEGIVLNDLQLVEGVAKYEHYFDPAIDALSAYITNQPFYYREKGIPYKVIRPLAYGVDFYGDCLFTSESEMKHHPDRVKAFREASMRGWEYAMAHTEEIIDLILTKYQPNKTRAHLQFEAEAIRELMLPNLVEIGHINPGRWQHIANIFSRLEMVEARSELEGFLYSESVSPYQQNVYWIIGLTAMVSFIGILITMLLLLFNRRLRREVAERKMSEKALKKSENEYRRLLASTVDWVWSCDLESRLTFTSKAVTHLLGYDVEEIRHKPTFQFLHPNERKRIAKLFQQAKAEHRGWRGSRIRWLHKDGSIRILESTAQPIFDPQNLLIGFSGIDRDITDRMQADIERQSHLDFLQSLERIETAIREAEDVEVMLDRVIKTVFDIFDCDRAWLLYPCDPEANAYRVPVEYFRPQWPGASVLNVEVPMAPDMAADCRMALDADEPLAFQETTNNSVPQTTAKRFGIRSRIFMALYPKIGNAWLFGMHQCEWSREWTADEKHRFREIGRRIADALNSLLFLRDLRASEERYRLLAENIEDVIWKTNLAFEWDYISPSIEKLTGSIPAEVMEVSLQELLTPHSFQTLKKRLREALRGSHRYRQDISITMEMEYYRKDSSTVWAEVTIRIQTDAQGNPKALYGVSRDITDRKIAESERFKLETQLHHAQRMESIGTLAGGIAHDFNNLLMGIQGRASLMLMDVDESDPNWEHLKGIEAYVKSAADLTSQLLGFARGGKYQISPTDPNRLIRKSAQMFGRTRKEIKIHIDCDSNVPTIAVDRQQIEQVLLNLFVNAWQAMPAGGDLFIHTEMVFLDGDQVQPLHVAEGTYVKISVTDTGIGMDPVTRQRVFDPFFTTKERGRGTGLGLASAYGIIKNHGGIITVYSEEGKGSTFNIYLPVSGQTAIEERASAEATLKGSETILLVDDEKIIIDVGEKMLQRLGYTVLSAQGGVEALELFEAHQDQIALVILDMIMPDMGGGETFDRLRAMAPGVRVMLSSGYSINGQASEIIERGCNGFIQKPFEMRKLSQKIRRILDAPENILVESTKRDVQD